MASEQDAAFIAVEKKNLKSLRCAQIVHRNERRFISPIDGFSACEVIANRAYFEMLFDRFFGDNGYAVNCNTARPAGFRDICSHPILLDHVEDVLGSKFLC